MRVGINETAIGTCSLCGGTVVIPTYWHSVVSPVPTCKSCGATKAAGPVIPMVPAMPRKTRDWTGTGTNIVDGDPVEITRTDDNSGTFMPKRSQVTDAIDPNRRYWW